MGKRGPKPLPTALRLAKGTPSHHRQNDAEPELPPPNDRTPPPTLAGLGLVEWHLNIDALIDKGVLTQADMIAFRQYCTVVTEVDELERKLATMRGLADRKLKWSKYLQTLRNRLGQQQAAIGLTPSSRSGVKAVKAPVSAEQANRNRFFGVKPA